MSPLSLSLNSPVAEAASSGFAMIFGVSSITSSVFPTVSVLNLKRCPSMGMSLSIGMPEEDFSFFS